MPNRVAALTQLGAEIVACERCARLREHCAAVARVKRKSYSDWDYWGRPVPGFGDPDARLWIIGLAPGAHGANRTGRVFTGDRSGDFLFSALHRAGLASQASSSSRDDGLTLRDCYISAAARCAPPGNRPTPVELAACAPFLDREWELLARKRAILALGRIAWDAAIAAARRADGVVAHPVPVFAHGSYARLGARLCLLGSYHVSQQNTFTGRLTEQMFDAVLARCRRAWEELEPGPPALAKSRLDPDRPGRAAIARRGAAARRPRSTDPGPEA